jgi:hypothetical protein
MRSALNLYEFDTALREKSWRRKMSVPFRRVATLDIIVDYGAISATSGRANVSVTFATNRALDNLPDMSDTDNAVWFSVMKLSTLLLSAAVMWIRSKRQTSSPSWLYRHSVRVVHNVATLRGGDGDGVSNSEMVQDAILGLLASLARLVISCMRLAALWHDNQGRVCVVNVLGAVCSMINWLIRFFVLGPSLPQMANGSCKEENTLARLGGSMAVVDTSCAVLLAFAEPPVMDALSTFDDTARALTGLLVSLSTLPRCLFAVACNSICFEAHNRCTLYHDPNYIYLVILSGAMWMLQATITAISVADLVITPIAVSTTRTVHGEDVMVSVALFLASVCVAVPRLLATCVHMTQDTFRPLKCPKSPLHS